MCDVWPIFKCLRILKICLGLKSNAYAFDSPSRSGRAHIMSLSRELTGADKSVRSQVVLASLDGSSDKQASECVWKENGFFGELKADFSIHNKDFSENALVYVNQAYLSIKDGEPIVYCDFAIIEQLIPMKNWPEDMDLESNRNYVKMYAPDYDHQSGKFLGVKENLAYIMIRNEEHETFFTYGFSAEHVSILFCYSRQCMPNVFKGTSFNTHKLQNIAEAKEGMSDIFFYLPSITDRKESVNRYRDQVYLVPVTCTLADTSKFSPEGYSFNPVDLDKDEETEECSSARQTVIEFFRNAAKFSNSNFIQNVYALIKEKNIDHFTLKWAPSIPQSKVDMGRFSTSF